jgi:hypothetical protein
VNSGLQVAWTTKFCTVTPSIVGSPYGPFFMSVCCRCSSEVVYRSLGNLCCSGIMTSGGKMRLRLKRK